MIEGLCVLYQAELYGYLELFVCNLQVRQAVFNIRFASREQTL